MPVSGAGLMPVDGSGVPAGGSVSLAIAVIVVRNGSGRDDGLTALVVIVFAFTMQLILSFLTRPRSR